jgi:hypothetical protein
MSCQRLANTAMFPSASGVRALICPRGSGAAIVSGYRSG